MTKLNLNFKKLLTPSDGLSIVVIIVGLMIAVFLPDMAIKLIGASVAVLGTVALFMLISQRFSNMVESDRFRRGSPPPGIKVVEKKDSKATRKIIDGYDTSFGPEKKETKAEKEEPREFSLGEEGFKIISKKDKPEKSENKDPLSEKGINQKDFEGNNISADYKVNDTNIKQKENIVNHKADNDKTEEQEYKGDDISGMKIIRTSVPKTTSEPTITLAPEDKKVSGESNASEKSKEDKTQQQIKQNNKSGNKIEIIESKEGYSKKPVNIPLSILMEESSQDFSFQPRKEFEYFLSAMIKTIRYATNSLTASFLLLNEEKKQMILESYVTEVPDSVINDMKIPLGKDIISRIMHNGNPEILSEINPSAVLDLIPYYEKTAGTSSFIGVPVFYEDSVIGVLCADSVYHDSYDEISVGLLGNFAKLISALVVSYTEKYDLMLTAKTLASVNRFRSLMYDRALTVENVFEALIEAGDSLLEYSRIGVCTYDESSGKWYLVKSLSKNDTKIKTPYKEILMQGSLISEAILDIKIVFVSELGARTIRLYEDETGMPGGYFAAAPLKSMAHNYGAVFLEASSSMNITENDIDILETLGEHTGTALEQIHYMNVIKSSKMEDRDTGILNPRAFYSRLEEELLRARDLKQPFILCLFSIDKYESLDPGKYYDRYVKAKNHILEMFSINIQSYEFLGSVESNIFGAVLFGKNLQDAQFLAERIRNETVGSPVVIEGKKFHVTLSIGIADSEKCKSTDELLNNANNALKISLKKTNTVTIFI